MFEEYPKWVYLTDGPQESYEDGMAPVLVENAEEEAALKTEPAKRRGRPPKAE